jgi:pyruvate kinase
LSTVIFTLGKASIGNMEELVSAGGNIARLTFSFGSNETQLRRARKLHELSDSCGANLRVAGELEGLGLRVGKIKNRTSEDILPIRGDGTVEFRDLPSVDVDSGERFVPVPGIKHVKMAPGDKLVYGDHKCIFEVSQVLDTGVLAIAQSSDEVVSTRSILLAGDAAPPMRFDEKNLAQFEFILGNNEFDLVIIPNVVDMEIIQDVRIAQLELYAG